MIIPVLIACSATRFACDLLVWCPETGAQRERLVSALLPLVLDAVSENLADLVALALERYVGTLDSDKCLALGTHTLIAHSYNILMLYYSTVRGEFQTIPECMNKYSTVKDRRVLLF